MKSTKRKLAEVRGTGRSSRQILNAAKGALFVCHDHGARRYFTDLARHLGREDIRVVPEKELRCEAGRRYPDVVFDHFAADNAASEHAVRLALQQQFASLD